MSSEALVAAAHLEGDDEEFVGAAAVSDGGLGAAGAGQVLRLAQVGGVRQVGDVPAPNVALNLCNYLFIGNIERNCFVQSHKR